MNKDKIIKHKIDISTQIQLAKNLSLFQKSGITLVDSLKMITTIDSSSIIRKITEGQTLYNALSSEYRLDDLFLQMIHVGEKCGSLSETLERTATLLQKRLDQKRKITGAFIYPGFIAGTTILISGFLILYIFPKILPLLTSMNIPLPILTKIIMYISSFILNHPISIIISIFLSIGTFMYTWKKYSSLKKIVFIIIVRTPILGKILQSSYIYESFSSLGSLLKYGQSLPESLGIISTSTSNYHYSSIFNMAEKSTRKGISLYDYFKKQSETQPLLIPPLVPEMLLLGEKTAGISDSCEYISAIFLSQLDELLARTTKLIEPVLMLFMGITVGSIALSIILPIYEITNHLSK